MGFIRVLLHEETLRIVPIMITRIGSCSNDG